MKAANKRTRKANFTDEEIRRLLWGIAREKEAIQCKLNNSLTFRRKKEAWVRVSKAVNGCNNGISVRTVDELRKKWKDLKAVAMREQADLNPKKAGGGLLSKENTFKDLIFFILKDSNDLVSGMEENGTDSFTASESVELSNVGKDFQSPNSLPENHTDSFEVFEPPATVKVEENVQSPKVISDSFTAEEPTALLKIEDNIKSSCQLSGEGSSNHVRMGMSNGHRFASQVSKKRSQSAISGTDSDGTDSDFPANIQFVMNTKARKRLKVKLKDDESQLFDSWLSSEIEKNYLKKELMRSQIELIKLKKQKLELELRNIHCSI